MKCTIKVFNFSRESATDSDSKNVAASVKIYDTCEKNIKTKLRESSNPLRDLCEVSLSCSMFMLVNLINQAKGEQ